VVLRLASNVLLSSNAHPF